MIGREEGKAIIETERLLLRNEVAGDYDIWMRDMNTNLVRRYLCGPESAERVRKQFDQGLKSQREKGYRFWLAALKTDVAKRHYPQLLSRNVEYIADNIMGDSDISNGGGKGGLFQIRGV